MIVNIMQKLKVAVCSPMLQQTAPKWAKRIELRDFAASVSLRSPHCLSFSVQRKYNIWIGWSTWLLHRETSCSRYNDGKKNSRFNTILASESHSTSQKKIVGRGMALTRTGVVTCTPLYGIRFSRRWTSGGRRPGPSPLLCHSYWLIQSEFFPSLARPSIVCLNSLPFISLFSLILSLSPLNDGLQSKTEIQYLVFIWISSCMCPP